MATMSLFLNIYNVFISLLQPSAGVYRQSRLTRTRRAGDCAAPRATCRRPFSCAWTLSAREQRDRLDVRGVRKHVDHARRGQRVAAIMHEHRGIAGERGRVAGHVDDARQARARRSRRQRLDELDGALARRVDQRLVERQERADASPAWPRTGWRPRNASLSSGRCTRAFPRRDGPSRRCLRRRRPAAPRRAIGSVKLPRPQKKSAIRSPGCGSSSASARRTSTRLISGLTCVNSVGENGIDDVELGQRVAELRVRRMEAVGRSPGRRFAATRRRRARPRTSAAWLRPPRQGLEDPEHQRVDGLVFSGRVLGRMRSIADRQLDLRQAVANRQALDQRRAAPAAAPRSFAAPRGIRACPPRSSTGVRGSPRARRPFSGRGAPKAARDAGSATLARALAGADGRASRDRCARAPPRARAAWPRPGATRPRAASSSRRIRRNAGSVESSSRGWRDGPSRRARSRTSACA